MNDLQWQNINETLVNEINSTISTNTGGIDSMAMVSAAIASVGIIANLTVAVAFLNHQKLRRKIPNIFIINQVSYALV